MKRIAHLLSLLVFALACLPGATAQAQLVVTTTADEDDGNALPGNGAGTSLREAVKYAKQPKQSKRTGPLLPYGLRYGDECAAANYAHHLARMTGARVLIFNRRGDIEFCELSKPIACARP